MKTSEKAREARAKWRAANREKIASSNATYYAKNREKISVDGAAYREANRQKIFVQRATYRAANPDTEKARNKQWVDAHRQELKDRRAEDYSTRRAHYLLASAAQRAKRSKVPCTITEEWIKERLQRGVCEVTGLPLAIGSREGITPFSPSLDKLIPYLGYTPSNTLLVCYGLNMLKRTDTDYGYALDFCRAVVAADRPAPTITEEDT